MKIHPLHRDNPARLCSQAESQMALRRRVNEDFFCIKQWHLASEEPVQQSDRTLISQHMNGALYLVPQPSVIY